MAPPVEIPAETYDRAKHVQEFDDSKITIKGLIDAGITTVPPFFYHPSDTLATIKPPSDTTPDTDVIPIIDLSGVNSDRRSTIVEQVSAAARKTGFFQVINHGIDPAIMERVIRAVKAFNEQPAEKKAPFYSRDMTDGFAFMTNVDLFKSKAANWNDAFFARIGPNPAKPEAFPEIMRDELLEWGQTGKKLSEVLMELLSEGLGVEKDRMKKLSFTEGPTLVGNYYPYCPQPDLTMGIKLHTDPGAFTVVIPSPHGRLQAKYGDDWVDVKYVPGSIVANIGDMIQIVSNDEYKSVEHRVLASSSPELRVTVVMFCHPSEQESVYGPMPELITPEKPARFREFNYMDYHQRWYNRDIDGRSMVNYYRI